MHFEVYRGVLKMFKVIGMGFLIISGLCLTAIGLRNNPKLFGWILSSKLNKNIDSMNKYLALTALIFFILAMIFLVILV